MTPLIIANWKMNFTMEEAKSFLSNLSKSEIKCDFVVAPPLAFLAYLTQQFPQIVFSSQDVSKYNDFGPYTGECSAKMLKSCNVKYAIIGHSERREGFYETNKIVRRKIENCVTAGVIPIVCVGENLESRKNNNYKDFIIEQLNNSVPNNVQEYIIAYEPIWAIGTGITPNTEEIKEIVELILKWKNSTKLANSFRLVYGGSANANNYKEIVAIPGISGLLIGSAAIDLDNFKKIISLK